ncbi:MAG: fatty acid desaturase [Alphaproteobacteria bacterium]|nr:fatty acid desaturase [Alphaproteobacteria bacterium]
MSTPDTTIVAAPIPPLEWPTLLLALALLAGFLALTWFHATMPWWLFVALGAVLASWYGSLQHELIHGHPTRRAGLNAALGFAPLALWLPYPRYRDTHLVHHRDERLTDPIDDPESRYCTPQAWAALGPLGRSIVATQGTLLGRLTLGPAWAIGGFLLAELRAVRDGDAALARVWLGHALALAPLLVWIFAVCGVPAWLYLLAFVQAGTALSLIRSFAEHRARPEIAHRTAIVENSRVLGPLFLFNNLHVAHHRWPHLPWYRLPAAYRAHRDALVAENGGLVYNGYGELFRRFLLRSHDRVVHPLGRAP